MFKNNFWKIILLVIGIVVLCTAGYFSYVKFIDNGTKDGSKNDLGGPYYHQIYSATSKDGLTWEKNNTLLFDHASVPGAVIKDGIIYLYFMDAEINSTTIAVAISKDLGKTFEKQTIKIDGQPSEGADPHPFLTDSGEIKLYYIVWGDKSESGRKANQIYTSNSTDGINFNDTNSVYEDNNIIDPDVFDTKNGLKMLTGNDNYSTLGLANAIDNESKFAKVDNFEFSKGGVPDTIKTQNVYRTYYCNEKGIASATGIENNTLLPEDGVRLSENNKTVCDPAVIQLPDESYLMFYKIQDNQLPASASNKSKNDTIDLNIKFAPSETEISATVNPEELINNNPNGDFVIRTLTSQPVSASSVSELFVFFDKNDLANLKKDFKLYKVNEWKLGISDGSDINKESDNFRTGAQIKSTELSMPDALGRIYISALYTNNGVKLSNPVLMFLDGTYTVLPNRIPLEKVFINYDYLNYSNTCPKDNQKIACQTLAFLFNRFNFNINFDNPFALKNPILYSFLIFGYFFLTILIIIFLVLSYLLTFIFQRKPWGVVFDSKTLKPIEGAIVRIFAEDNNKLLETRITGLDGRFNFLTDKGVYYIRIIKPDYIFPTRLITKFHHPVYYHIYHNENINIKSDDAVFITNIPLDPTNKLQISHKLSVLKILIFKTARARTPFFFCFFALAIVNYLLKPIPSFSGISIWLFITLAIIALELYYRLSARKVKILVSQKG